MSRYVLREQQASYVLPARSTTEPQPKRRTPLPDMGEPATRRLPTSARRYAPTTQGSMRLVVHDLRTHKQQPTRAQAAPREPEQVATPRKKNPHALTLIGSGMVLMALLYFLCTSIGAFWQSTSDNWTYGTPRTYHTDHRVGHSDETIPSHFIAMNLSRQVRIIEFPGNDASKAKVYVGPVLQGKDQQHTPVTLAFRDVNGDRKVDMLILVRSVPVGVFINDVINDVPQFRPAQTEEQMSLEKGLGQ